MPLRLNTESITAIDDRGFALAINIRDFRPVVLSIEVHRALLFLFDLTVSQSEKNPRKGQISKRIICMRRKYTQKCEDKCVAVKSTAIPIQTYQEVRRSCTPRNVLSLLRPDAKCLFT